LLLLFVVVVICKVWWGTPSEFNRDTGSRQTRKLHTRCEVRCGTEQVTTY